MLLQENPSAEHLLDLVGRLDCFLRLHHRRPALVEAEWLLEAVCEHHWTLHALRQSCDDAVLEHLESLVVTLIADVALLIEELRDGGRWPPAGLRRNVAEFAQELATKATSMGIAGSIEAMTARRVPTFGPRSIAAG